MSLMIIPGRYELSILRCDAEDAAEWRAEGKNAFGSCESRCKMSVKIPDGFAAPHFSVRLLPPSFLCFLFIESFFISARSEQYKSKAFIA